MKWSDEKVLIGEDGFGEFMCSQCSVSVFVNEAAEGRDLFGKRYATYTSGVTSSVGEYLRLISIKTRNEPHSTGRDLGQSFSIG